VLLRNRDEVPKVTELHVRWLRLAMAIASTAGDDVWSGRSPCSPALWVSGPRSGCTGAAALPGSCVTPIATAARPGVRPIRRI